MFRKKAAAVRQDRRLLPAARSRALSCTPLAAQARGERMDPTKPKLLPPSSPSPRAAAAHARGGAMPTPRVLEEARASAALLTSEETASEAPAPAQRPATSEAPAPALMAKEAVGDHQGDGSTTDTSFTFIWNQVLAPVTEATQYMGDRTIERPDRTLPATVQC